MPEFAPTPAHALFGQPHRKYTVPAIWTAALAMIRDKMDLVMWNIHQTEYKSPFNNSGARFECPVFAVEAYSWDDKNEQPFNFKWGDIEISWYKYLGRGMSANRDLSPNEASAMLEACLAAVRDLEENAR